MVYGTRKITEPATTTVTSTAGITWPHNLTTLGEMSTSAGGGFGLGVGVGVGVAGGPTLAAAQQGQGVAALLVMLAVLCFIFAYCCWGAPFCRSLCRRYCCCRLEDPEPDPRFGNSDQAMVATPTIILLPHGRMLVVDGTIFTQFQSDTTGLDLVELGDSMIRAQRNPRTLNRHQLQNSQGSILEMDAETPSKDSLGSIGCFPPPTYESIYGKEESDMPPSYSDILLHRFANLPHEIDMHDYCHDGKEEIEMQSLESCPHIVGNPMNALPYPYAAVTSFSSQSFPRRNISRNPSIISNPLDNYYMDNELDIYRFDQGMVPAQCVNVSNNGSGTWDDRRLANDNENENRRPTDNGNQSAQNEELTLNNETRHVHIAQETNNAVDGNEIMNTRNRARSISRISQEDERTNCENVQRAIGESVVEFGISSYLAQTEISHEGAMDGSRNNSNRNENADACRVPRGYAEDRTSAGNSISERNRNDGTAADGSYLSRHMRNSNASIVSDSIAHAGDSEGIYPDEDGGNFGALADIRESRV